MSDNEEEGNPTPEERLATKDKLDKLLRHVSNVQEACELLAKKLIDKGEANLGIRLAALGQIHDHSKFFGIEWDYLVGSDNMNGELKLAASHHARANMHHPEYWDGVENMPRIAVAEMVCDW